MNEDEDRNALISRIGTFFILIGVLVIFIFIASDMGEKTSFTYFFLGTILLSFGFILKRKTAAPPPPSNRFIWLRRMMQKNREARAKRASGQQHQKQKK